MPHLFRHPLLALFEACAESADDFIREREGALASPAGNIRDVPAPSAARPGTAEHATKRLGLGDK
jgi:hypothetical protein